MWPQHIIHRGNNRQPTFFADEGYQLYLECSADAAKHQACDIHAYVLMTNPVHLLVTPRQPQGVSKLVLSCYRYIELNPVRAAIVKDPMEYRWSSYPRNAQGRLDLRVTEQREYTALGADRPSRALAYRELFTVDMDAELLDEIRRNLNQCRVFGADRFKEEIEAILQRLV